MPCRACSAAPGTACEWAGIAAVEVDGKPTFHATRISDAQLSVAVLIEIARSEQEANFIRAKSPAVIVRKPEPGL